MTMSKFDSLRFVKNIQILFRLWFEYFQLVKIKNKKDFFQIEQKTSVCNIIKKIPRIRREFTFNNSFFLSPMTMLIALKFQTY